MSILPDHHYRAYLQSTEWAAKRKARLDRDGRRCTGCGGDGEESRLEVHHLTYERLGFERIEDLVTLCNLCHAREHGRAPLQGPVAEPDDLIVEQRRIFNDAKNATLDAKRMQALRCSMGNAMKNAVLRGDLDGLAALVAECTSVSG